MFFWWQCISEVFGGNYFWGGLGSLRFSNGNNFRVGVLIFQREAWGFSCFCVLIREGGVSIFKILSRGKVFGFF